MRFINDLIGIIFSPWVDSFIDRFVLIFTIELIIFFYYLGRYLFSVKIHIITLWSLDDAPVSFELKLEHPISTFDDSFSSKFIRSEIIQ